MFVGLSEMILMLLVVLIIFILPAFLKSKGGQEFKTKLYGIAILLVLLLLIFTKIVFTLFGVILLLFALLLFTFFLLARKGTG